MKSKTLKAGLAAAVVLIIAAYWYWSPFLVVWQMRNAAQERDAQAFNTYVDYPKLRDSIKDQFSALYSDTPEESAPDNDLAKAGSHFGKMLGLLVVNKFVDTVVRPELVMRAIREGYLTPKLPKRKATDPAGGPGASGNDEPADGGGKKHLVFERQGADRLLIYADGIRRSDTAPPQDKLAMVFERSGFATWKLSEVVLPPR